jgi:hypothetical protein
MTKRARQKRQSAYNQLKVLASLSARQIKKLIKLENQIKIDKNYAYQCFKVK